MQSRPAFHVWLWMLIASAVLCQIASNFARPLISYKVLALGGDSIAIGLISASYAFIPLTTALWLGRISDRRNSLRGLVATGTALLAAAPIVLSNSPSLFIVGVGSTILGMGQLCFTIAGQSAIARFVRPKSMDSAFGWFTAAFSAGQMIGPLLAGLAMGAAGEVSPEVRLQNANSGLLLAGIISLLAVPIAFGSSAKKDGAPKDNLTSPPLPESITSLLRYPTVGTNIIASLALLTTTDILVAFLPLVAEEKAVPPIIVGLLLATRAAASICSRLLLPVLLARSSRPGLVLISLAGTAATLSLLPWVIQLPWIAAALLAVGGFFLGIGQPVTMTLVTQAVPAASKGAVLAVRLLGNRVGQVGLPAAAGLLAAPIGPSGALWMSCLVLAAACLRSSKITGN